MKTFILYRPNSEHERSVTDYVHDFKRVTGHSLELVSLDTRDGANKAELYGVIDYPAIIAVDDQGQMQKMWQKTMPLISELSYFTRE